MVDTENDLVLAKVPGHPVSVFLAFAGILGFVATFVLVLGVGFPGADELAMPALSTIAIVASLDGHRGASRTSAARFLHVDLDRWSFAYPADGESTPLPKSPSLGVSSTETNIGQQRADPRTPARARERLGGRGDDVPLPGPGARRPGPPEVLRDRLRPGGG